MPQGGDLVNFAVLVHIELLPEQLQEAWQGTRKPIKTPAAASNYITSRAADPLTIIYTNK